MTSGGGRLAGKVALITGGAAGIGESIARLFKTEGASVMIADINRPRGTELASELGAEFVETNVADEESVVQAVNATVKMYGALDVMVNNAGIGGRRGDDPATWWRYFDIDLLGVAWGTRHAVRTMAGRGGAIVNIGSHAGQRGCRIGPYGAAKAASHTLMRYTALEHGPDRIRANAVLPGNIFTTIHDVGRQEAIAQYVAGDRGAFAVDPLGSKPVTDEAEVVEEFRRRHPMGRLAEPGDIAKAALFLASDDALVVTGNEFMATGGILPRRLDNRLLAAAAVDRWGTPPPPPLGAVAVVSANAGLADALATGIEGSGADAVVIDPDIARDENHVLAQLASRAPFAGLVFAMAPDPGGTLLTQDASTWQDALLANARVPWAIGCQAGALIQPGGALTFVADSSGLTGSGGSAAFSAASAALIYSTDELADNLRTAAIRVNCVIGERISRPPTIPGLGATASSADIAGMVVEISRGLHAVTGAQISMETSHP
jgi:NAD(P)-dependent dehydrogenase (short-subunit alcohol dehydrogenase family)